jgi:hypothetical protein
MPADPKTSRQKRTPEEQSILDFVSKSHGPDWVERHAKLILEQGRSVGMLDEEAEPNLIVDARAKG